MASSWFGLLRWRFRPGLAESRNGIDNAAAQICPNGFYFGQGEFIYCKWSLPLISGSCNVPCVG